VAGKKADKHRTAAPSATAGRTDRAAGESDAAVARALLRWFLAEARDLPWRRTLDPYAIWISEIMLQQTQVRTVIPYWERWMRELPDVAALAAVEMDRLLKLWEGLGYYTRARNLQAAARQIQERHGGVFPRTHAEVLALKGIGRYTAGAICSVAFNQAEPLVDGNVIRVLTRLGALEEDPRGREANEHLWSRAASLVAAAASQPPCHAPQLAGNCSAFNQSMMELGATVCTPRAPECGRCPLSGMCRARVLGRPEEFPRMPKRAKPTRRRVQAFVLEDRGGVWVRRRPEGVVNAGLWEFPNVEIADGAEPSPEESLREHLGVALEAASLRPVAVVRHSITRYRIELRAYHAKLADARGLASAAARRVTVAEAASLAFTSAHARVLKAWVAGPAPGAGRSRSKPRSREV
jgi:A/G-specific adenine glycosylase